MSIEEDFKAVIEAHTGEINAALRRAVEALDEATDLADKYGIPFYSNISMLGQTYQPKSYDKLWNNEAWRQERDTKDDSEDDLFTQVTGDYPGEYDGWQHSAVCY